MRTNASLVFLAFLQSFGCRGLQCGPGTVDDGNGQCVPVDAPDTDTDADSDTDVDTDNDTDPPAPAARYAGAVVDAQVSIPLPDDLMVTDFGARERAGIGTVYVTASSGPLYVVSDPVDGVPLTDQAVAVQLGVQGWGSLAFADLTGDGIEDVGAAQFYGGAYRVFPGGPTAGTVLADAIAISDPPDHIEAAVTGDFDGDGAQDLALMVPNAGASGVVAVFRGPLSASMPWTQASWTFTPAERPQSVTTGDFDGDGTDDLAVTAPGGSTVLDGPISAGFHDGVGAPHQLPGSASVAAGDIDGDGLDDLFLDAGGRASVFRGPLPAVASPTGGNHRLSWTGGPLALADLDGDGMADALWNQGSAGVALAYGPPPTLLDEGDEPVRFNTGTAQGGPFRTGDADGDGLTDVITLLQTGEPRYDQRLQVFSGAGRPEPWATPSGGLPRWSGSMSGAQLTAPVGIAVRRGAILPMDANGSHSALIAGNEPGDILHVWRLDGLPADGALADVAAGELIGSPGVYLATPPCGGDLDGDGVPDVVMALSDGIAILQGPYADHTDFSGALRVALPPGSEWRHVAVGDVDGDGQDDLVATFARTIRVFHGPITADLTAAAASAQIEYDGGDGLDRLEVGDVSGDGIADIVALTSFTTWIHEGPVTSGSFALADDATHQLVGGRIGPLFDVTGDGIADVLANHSDGIAVLHGPVDDQPTSLGLWSIQTPLVTPFAADLDGDGIGDVIARDFPFQLEVYYGPHTGPMDGSSVAATFPLGQNLDVSSAAGDLDGDGADDLLLVIDDSQAGITRVHVLSGTP